MPLYLQNIEKFCITKWPKFFQNQFFYRVTVSFPAGKESIEGSWEKVDLSTFSLAAIEPGGQLKPRKSRFALRPSSLASFFPKMLYCLYTLLFIACTIPEIQGAPKKSGKKAFWIWICIRSLILRTKFVCNTGSFKNFGQKLTIDSRNNWKLPFLVTFIF